MRCLKIPTLQAHDFTFEAGQLAIWTVAEISTTIMASSIPVLRILIVKAIKTGRSQTGRSQTGYHRSMHDGTFKHGRTHTTIITSSGSRRGRKTSEASSSTQDEELGLGRREDTTGKIVKVETVSVDYDTRTLGGRNSIGLGIELERVTTSEQVR